MAAKKPNKPAGECGCCADLRVELAVLREQVNRQRVDQERWGSRAWTLVLAAPGLVLLVMRLAGH